MKRVSTEADFAVVSAVINIEQVMEKDVAYNLRRNLNPSHQNKVAEAPLRVNPDKRPFLLSYPEFIDVPTDELIYRAEVRLGLARQGAIRGIRIDDRAMAIAILIGIPDRTEDGM